MVLVLILVLALVLAKAIVTRDQAQVLDQAMVPFMVVVLVGFLDRAITLIPV